MDQSIQTIQEMELPPTVPELKHWAAVDCVFEVILKAEYPKVRLFVINEEFAQLSRVNLHLQWDAIQRGSHLEREKILDRMGYSKLIKKIEKVLPEIYNRENGAN